MKRVRKIALLAATAALFAIGAQTASTLATPASSEEYQTTLGEDRFFTKLGFHRDGFFDYAALVEQGVIDQETADKIANYQLDKRISAIGEQKAELEKIKAMAPEERRAYFEKQKAEFESGSAQKSKVRKYDLLKALVTDGIITQEQADAIKAALPEKAKEDGHKSKEKIRRQQNK
jgi:uncharacterized protein YutE (UPF0331/DUF86 family)